MEFFGFCMILIGILLVGFTVLIFINDHLESRRFKREDAEFAEYETVAEEKAASFYKSLALKYPHLGEPSYEIVFDDFIKTRKVGYWYKYSFDSIIIWEERKMFMLTQNKIEDGEVCSEPIPFSTLLSYRMVKVDRIIRGNCQAITKVNKLGAFTRGTVGGLLFGYKGAVVGVLSTPITTEIKSEPDRMFRTYKIHLTLNNSKTPYFVLNFKHDEKQMRKVLSILKMIKQENIINVSSI